ncbi:MAG: TetR/AcrR family transcriptional regulator [Vicinamibacterales bacterium]
MHGNARRQQLIETALHVFATRGFRGATTKAIAEAAGVSEAMIFRHFPTKNDLYLAIIQDKASRHDVDGMLDELRTNMMAGDDSAVVRQIAERTLETFARDRDYQRVMLLAALEGHDLASLSRETFGLPIFALLRDYVEERQADGAFRRGDATLQAFSLVALPVYFAIVTSLFGMDLAAPAANKTAGVFSELVLDGLRPRSGGPRRPGTGSAGRSAASKRRASRKRRRS